MARHVKIASILPPELPWLDRRDPHNAANQSEVLGQVAAGLETLKGLGLDLLVTCEMIEAKCQSMSQAESVDQPGPLMSLYQQFAREEHCTVAGSVKIKEGANIHNSIAYFGPDGGVLGVYHKTFLTRSEIEEGLTPGRGAQVVQTPAGLLGGVICFDLNFTELADQYAALKPDILTFASMYHGGLMQAQWAYGCRSWFVASLPFIGGGIVDPFGRELATTNCYSSSAIATINLDRVMVHLDGNRDHFPAILRKYPTQIHLDIPANLGPAMITSLADDVSAMDIVQEYGLTLMDDYLTSSRQINQVARKGEIV